MPTDIDILIGAGGHAKVVLDAWINASKPDTHIQLVDDNEELHRSEIFGCPIIGAIDIISWLGRRFHVGIGRNSVRRELYEQITAVRGIPHSIVHPSATVSAYATIAPGAFVAAGAVLAPGAIVGIGTIVNHCSVLDHDSSLGDYSHIAPGATVAGGVTIGKEVLVGAGAKILPGIVIGDRATIGAGAVVTGDISPGVIVSGIPARNHQKTRT